MGVELGPAVAALTGAAGAPDALPGEDGSNHVKELQTRW
jgi:hypothetical protein